MNKQVIREALEFAMSFDAPYSEELLYTKAMAELDTPAPQSAREVALDIDDSASSVRLDYMSNAIESYAESRVQEALVKIEKEYANEYHGKAKQ